MRALRVAFALGGVVASIATLLLVQQQRDVDACVALLAGIVMVSGASWTSRRGG